MPRHEEEHHLDLVGPATVDAGMLLREAGAVLWQREVGTGRLPFIGPGIESLLGYPAHLWMTEGFWEGVIHPDERAAVSQRMRELLDDPMGGTLHYRAVTASGESRWLTDTVLGGATGDRTRRIGFTTRAARHVTHAAHSELLVTTAFEATREAIVLVRLRDGIIVEANRSWCDLTDTVAADARGQPFAELRAIANPDEVQHLVDAVRTGRHIRDAWLTLQRGDGQVRHLQMVAERVMIAGEPHMLAHGSDTTEHLSLAQQQRQSQKMEALGRLAGGIAHDFNNLLTVISSFAQLAEEDLADADSVLEALREIHRASFRAAELTSMLLSFSRGTQTARVVLDLDLLIEELRRMLVRVIGTQISLIHEPSDRPALVTASRGELEQVLVNLVVNSRDAMPAGGTIVIRVRHMHVNREDGLVPDGFVIPPGRYVMVDVRDTGTGIPAPAREHVFEPFFSTKLPGEGTGIGLSTAYAIIRQHGGHIWFDTTTGAGTTFHIVLPAAEPDDG
jgi:two-component system cell cycle sensor histidine kinase/response regulator CckA